jgi:hypothetical protein
VSKLFRDILKPVKWSSGRKSNRSEWGRYLGVTAMSEPSVCLNRKFLIKGVSIDQVGSESHRILKEIGLKLKKEATIDGNTSIFAAEGALVPITMRVISYPLRLSEYISSAQRAGIHILLTPAPDGVNMYVCGFSVGDLSGRPEKYPEVSIEEVTDTLKALDFEEKFINTIVSSFADIKEVTPKPND